MPNQGQTFLSGPFPTTPVLPSAGSSRALMTWRAIATSVGGRFVGARTAAILSVVTAALAVFLALLHAAFHVFILAAGLGVFPFAFVFAATSHRFLGVALVMMATSNGILHVIAVMAAGFRCGRGS